MKKKNNPMIPVRRLTTAALLVLLIAGTLPFSGAEGKTPLDIAFDNDELVLVETDFPVVRAEDFESMDELWQLAGIIGQDGSVTGEIKATWLSLSPAGNSGILTAGRGIDMCCYNGKYHFVYPSSTRGVEDRYSNLDRRFSNGFLNHINEEGFVYSPDGQYAAVFDKNSVPSVPFFPDPIIFDLSTGEMILTATYDNYGRENTGCVTTAVFSSDGRYFYYMLYGNTAQFHTALYRYDLQQDKTELCYSGSDLDYDPRLSETVNGDFLILRDGRDENTTTAGITRISDQNGEWEGDEVEFDLPMKRWHGKCLMYSADTGYAFILGRNEEDEKLNYCDYAFQRVRPDEGFAGLNQYWFLSKEDNQLRGITTAEINSIFDNWPDMGTSDLLYRWSLPFYIIKTARMSPDGRYVLLHVHNDGTQDDPNPSDHLFLVRLDDLAVREIRGIDPSRVLFGKLGSNYLPQIEWNTDTLIINTKDGIQAYRFQQP